MVRRSVIFSLEDAELDFIWRLKPTDWEQAAKDQAGSGTGLQRTRTRSTRKPLA